MICEPFRRHNMDCDEIGKTIKSVTHKVPVICLSPLIGASSSFAEHILSSHEPDDLLNSMRSMFGDPLQQDDSAA